MAQEPAFDFIAPRLGPFPPVPGHPKYEEAPAGYYDFTAEEVALLKEMKQRLGEGEQKKENSGSNAGKDQINAEKQ